MNVLPKTGAANQKDTTRVASRLLMFIASHSQTQRNADPFADGLAA